MSIARRVVTVELTEIPAKTIREERYNSSRKQSNCAAQHVSLTYIRQRNLKADACPSFHNEGHASAFCVSQLKLFVLRSEAPIGADNKSEIGGG